MEKAGVINWLLPNFYMRDSSILPQVVNPIELESWKHIQDKVVLAAASIHSDVDKSRIAVGGEKNHGSGNTRVLFAHLTTQEFEFWKTLRTPESVTKLVLDRVQRAKPWAPICPPDNPDEVELALEFRRQRRVEISRDEIADVLGVAASGLVRSSQLLHERQGVVHAPGLINNFTNADTARKTISVEEQQRADSNKFMKKVKKNDLLAYCRFYKLDITWDRKAFLINKIMDHVSLTNGNLDEVGQGLVNNPEQYAPILENLPAPAVL